MRVQVAAQVVELHQRRDRPGACPGELGRPLADLGRNRLVPEATVDLVLVVGLEDLAGLDRLDAPLGHLEAALDRVLAHRDVVRLRAREVLQEVAVGRRGHDAQIDLHAVVGHDRSLGVAATDDRRGDRLLAEPSDQGGCVVRGGDQVDVADRLDATAQRAGLARADAGLVCTHALEDRRGEAERAIEQDLGLARPGARLDRLEDLLLLALGDARVPAERAGASGGLQLAERGDPELVVDAAGRLRADARNPLDLDEALGQLRAQLLERRERPGLAQLLDLRGDRVADAIELGQPALLGESPDGLVRLAHAGGSPPVGENPVHDRTIELIQVAERVDDLGDLAVGERHSCMISNSVR